MPVCEEVRAFKEPVAGQYRFVSRAWPPHSRIVAHGDLQRLVRRTSHAGFGMNSLKLFDESVFVCGLDSLRSWRGEIFHRVTRLCWRPVEPGFPAPLAEALLPENELPVLGVSGTGIHNLSQMPPNTGLTAHCSKN
jgi:hypothetical protein